MQVWLASGLILEPCSLQKLMRRLKAGRCSSLVHGRRRHQHRLPLERAECRRSCNSNGCDA